MGNSTSSTITAILRSVSVLPVTSACIATELSFTKHHHNPFPFPRVQRSVMKWITKEEKNNHHQMPRHVTNPQSHLHTIHPSPKHFPRRKWSVLWVFFISHNMGKGGHKDRGPGPPPFRILSSSLTSFLFSQHGSKGKMVQG